MDAMKRERGGDKRVSGGERRDGGRGGEGDGGMIPILTVLVSIFRSPVGGRRRQLHERHGECPYGTRGLVLPLHRDGVRERGVGEMQDLKDRQDR